MTHLIFLTKPCPILNKYIELYLNSFLHVDLSSLSNLNNLARVVKSSIQSLITFHDGFYFFSILHNTTNNFILKWLTNPVFIYLHTHNNFYS